MKKIIFGVIALVAVLGIYGYTTSNKSNTPISESPSEQVAVAQGSDVEVAKAVTDNVVNTSNAVDAESPIENISGIGLEAPDEMEKIKETLTKNKLEIEASTPKIFEEFTQESYVTAKESGENIVLLFFSNWCPTCVTEINTAINPAIEELNKTNALDGTQIFHLHVGDKQTTKDQEAIQKEFQVIGRHTKIFIDGETGEVRKTAPENWTKERYLKELTSF